MRIIHVNLHIFTSEIPLAEALLTVDAIDVEGDGQNKGFMGKILIMRHSSKKLVKRSTCFIGNSFHSGKTQENTPTYCGWLRNPASQKGWLKPHK